MNFLQYLKENYKKILIFICIIIIVIFCYFLLFDIQKTNFQTINREKEKLLGMDSDGDSINDYDEINKYKTDPYKSDTDDDGILDNLKIELGTSLNNEDTDGDGLFDGKAQYINGKKSSAY